MISDDYLKSYCYSGHYVSLMLVNGYKFDKETWKNIVFQKEVGGENKTPFFPNPAHPHCRPSHGDEAGSYSLFLFPVFISPCTKLKNPYAIKLYMPMRCYSCQYVVMSRNRR